MCTTPELEHGIACLKLANELLNVGLFPGEYAGGISSTQKFLKGLTQRYVDKLGELNGKVNETASLSSAG